MSWAWIDRLGLLMAATGTAQSRVRCSWRAGAGWLSWSMQVTSAAAFALLVILSALAPSVIIAAPLLFGAGLLSAAYMAINQTVLQLHRRRSARAGALHIPPDVGHAATRTTAAGRTGGPRWSTGGDDRRLLYRSGVDRHVRDTLPSTACVAYAHSSPTAQPSAPRTSSFRPSNVQYE